MKTLFSLFLCCLLYGQLIAQESRKGKDIAVFFAIEDYKNPWPKLNNPIKEAEELQTILKNDYGFETQMYKNSDLKAIMQQLEALLKRQYAEDGQLFIFFSGHGEFRSQTREGFFIPANAAEETSYLNYLSLRRKIDAIPCKHILLMIDACYAGTFDDEIAFRDRPDGWGQENPQLRITELLKDKTRYFASSAAKERSPDKSQFAAQLIIALRQPPSDGILTISNIRLMWENIHPQPHFNGFAGHAGGNFLFLSTQKTNSTQAATPNFADSDQDGTPDKLDLCPADKGVECAEGCPDSDGDCITEKYGKDKCPYAKGSIAFEGCPDSDGDGIPDHKDVCKDKYGTRSDGCPEKTALIVPKDTDKDGVVDTDDECLNEKGSKKTKGCPDSDDDGVPDKTDNCPNKKGIISNNGCPEQIAWGLQDTDEDGIVDSDDRCPNEKGSSQTNGCPNNDTKKKFDLPNNMILVKGGTFEMGSNGIDAGTDEVPVHNVTIDDFYIGKYEITNTEFCTFLNEEGNKQEGGVEWIQLDGSFDEEKCRIYKQGNIFKVENGYEHFPVIFVSWYGAKAYCMWLSKTKEILYDLPTEAQWEYAARSGGKTYKYSWGNSLTPTNGSNLADETAKQKYVNWTVCAGYRDGYVYSCAVENSGINEIGLYGMTGNVWEWCADWYDVYHSGNTKNPLGPKSGIKRVLRGGSWLNDLENASCMVRSNRTPSYRHDFGGFRVAITP